MIEGGTSSAGHTCLSRNATLHHARNVHLAPASPTHQPAHCREPVYELGAIESDSYARLGSLRGGWVTMCWRA